MPSVRLIDPPGPAPRPHRRAAAHEQELAQAKDLLEQAGATGQVIELTLAPEERDETLKVRYRAVARAIGCTLQFQTLRHRPYRDRKGNDREEAEVLLVVVTPGHAASRRRRVS